MNDCHQCIRSVLSPIYPLDTRFPSPACGRRWREAPDEGFPQLALVIMPTALGVAVNAMPPNMAAGNLADGQAYLPIAEKRL